ncbi:MAG: polysaccharide biosynthesis/export family protein [Planctomycetota bacterium]
MKIHPPLTVLISGALTAREISGETTHAKLNKDRGMYMRRIVSATVIVLILFMTTGCHQHALRIESNQPEWSEEEAQSRSDERRREEKELRNAISEWRARHDEEMSRYRIGAGDRLEVTIYDLEEPGEPSTRELPVSRAGTVKLPWVGRIEVAGQSAEGAAGTIAGAYEDGYLREAEVELRVVEYGSKEVTVLGAVEEPGTYVLESNRTTVLEALLEAGGVSDGAGDYAVLEPGGPGGGDTLEVTNGDDEAGDRLRVDLNRLLREGDMSMNVQVLPDHALVVPPAGEGFYVLGYVTNQGRFEFPGNRRRIGVALALAHAGGLSAQGRPRNAYLVSPAADGMEVTPVDLSAVMSGEVEPPVLTPGEGLVVGTDMLGRAGEILSGTARIGSDSAGSFNIAP